MHKTGISVASIPVQQQKEEASSMLRKHKREWENLPAGVKYHKIYYTKKAKTEDEGETFLPTKDSDKKTKKRMI